jgi:hypothetical protein
LPIARENIVDVHYAQAGLDFLLALAWKSIISRDAKNIANIHKGTDAKIVPCTTGDGLAVGGFVVIE